MLFVRPDGSGVDVPAGLSGPAIRDRLVNQLRAAGHTVAEIAGVLNISATTVERRLRALRVAALAAYRHGRLTPLCGNDPNWSPAVECRKPLPECPRCGSDRGPIQPGSRLVCLACLRSGCDEIADEEGAAGKYQIAAADAAREAEQARQIALRRNARRARTVSVR